MAVDSYDPILGFPQFSDAGAPDIAVDPTAVAAYAADVGNFIIRNTSGRNAYAYKREGLMCYDTDIDALFIHSGTGWEPWLGNPGAWTNLPYPNGAQYVGFGHPMAYKVGVDHVELRGTWQRTTTSNPVYTGSGTVVLGTLPPAIHARVQAASYFLAPGSGTGVLSLQYAMGGGGNIEVKGNSVGTSVWVALDGWRIPLSVSA